MAHLLRMPTPDEVLPGRDTPMSLRTQVHGVLGTPLQPPWPAGYAVISLAMGCFWGAERKLWQQAGVHVTAVGYQQGGTPHPTYREVCTGLTGHTEVVLVVYRDEPAVLAQLLQVFWENHDPTQGMRQGGDVGTQYRSGIYCTTAAQLQLAIRSRQQYAAALSARGLGAVTTEVEMAAPFYYAEDDHQQYLHKNPNGYCGLGGTGVRCPEGLGSV